MLALKSGDMYTDEVLILLCCVSPLILVYLITLYLGRPSAADTPPNSVTKDDDVAEGEEITDAVSTDTKENTA
jgi:hypothetical protein